MRGTLKAMGEFTDEMLKAMAAANELIRREVTQALADGHSTHFMREGRIIERTRDGDFELIQVGDELVRSHKVATDQGSSEPLDLIPDVPHDS
jgi:hypothetical protein